MLIDEIQVEKVQLARKQRQSHWQSFQWHLKVPIWSSSPRVWAAALVQGQVCVLPESVKILYFDQMCFADVLTY